MRFSPSASASERTLSIAARKRHDLSIQLHESIERGSGTLSARGWRHGVLERTKSAAGFPFRRRHSLLDVGHRLIFGFRDMRCLQDLNPAHRSHRGRAQRFRPAIVFHRTSSDRCVDGAPERLGGLFSGTEREPLRFQIRVLDRERQDLSVNLPILN